MSPLPPTLTIPMHVAWALRVVKLLGLIECWLDSVKFGSLVESLSFAATLSVVSQVIMFFLETSVMDEVKVGSRGSRNVSK